MFLGQHRGRVLGVRLSLLRFCMRSLIVLSTLAAVQVVRPQLALSEPTTRYDHVELPDASDHAVGVDTQFPVSHIGVGWNGDKDAGIEVAWRHMGGTWSPWTSMESDAPLHDDLQSGDLLVSVDATRVAVRVLSGRADNIKLSLIDTIHGERHLQANWGTTTTAPAGASTPAPSIKSRAEWGADESIRRGNPSFAPVHKFVVHHTATANNDPDPAATVRAIEVFHVRDRGWDDIAYNYLIDSSGQIYEGRYSRPYAPGEPITADDGHGNGVIGAHVAGYNVGSIGISLIGNYSLATPSPEMIASLKYLIGWQADRLGIDPLGSTEVTRPDGSTFASATVVGHRDLPSSTDCPGENVHNQLTDIRLGAAPYVTSVGRATGSGYWVAGVDGSVTSFGGAAFYGSLVGKKINGQIVALRATPTGRGYWLLGSDGGIFTFGDAGFFGSTGSTRLNAPIISFESTPTGRGYWLVAGDGGIFTFGDAAFFGSTGSMRLNAPVVTMASTPTGRGYWLVAGDGGIFTFGDAVFRGSTGSMRLNAPVLGMDASSDGRGYWLVAADGGVFTFNTPYLGSIPGLGLRSFAGSRQLVSTENGNGYYILGNDGGVFTFGQAPFLGSRSGKPAAGMAVLPLTAQ